MAHQASVGKVLNRNLNVFSNEKLLKIARNMLYHNSIAYLKTVLKIKKDNRVYVLHYHYNLIEDNIADCGDRETRNIAFSYFDPEYPEKEFYTTGSECLFFDDPQLLNYFGDTYKKLLLKKYTLLSFINEYKDITTFNQNSKNNISDQLKRVKQELLFRFNNVFTEYDWIGDNEAQDYVKYHKSDYPIKSLEYKSDYIAFDGRISVDTKVDPNDEELLKIKLKELDLELEIKEETKKI